jgi:hypothetical protein
MRSARHFHAVDDAIEDCVGATLVVQEGRAAMLIPGEQ